jgi:hypothetical protein
VAIFDLWAIFYVHVIAMEAPADDIAQFGFGASASATGPLVPLLDGLKIGLGSHRFSNALLLLC